MSKDASHFYEFEPFRIDPLERLLFRGHEPIALPPKAFETLLILVRNSGHLVSKEDLMKRLWPDTFVEEANLSQNIFVLRKALGETAQDPRYIATVPGRGYRFLQKVREVPAQAAAEPVSAPEPAVVPGVRFNRRLRAIAAVVALLVVAASFLIWHRSRASARLSPPRVMLAVLPFVNLTGDPTQEYVSDGLTEEMIAQLGELNHEGMGVIARTSAMTYKSTAKPVAQIGEELGVQYVLEGSVRRWGDRVRISAQLIQTRDQTHLWAQNYESDRQDILKLQSEVAQEIAEQIQLTLTPRQRARAQAAPRVDPHVYELYLLGRYEWNKRTGAGLGQAIKYFQEAVTADPKYAPAYAGLAQAYVLLPYYSGGSTNAEVGKAKSAAGQALRLDDTNAEAHATLGFIEASHLNWPAAGLEYQRALEINPNYATARQWYAFFLWMTDRQDEALNEMDHARQLDPLSLIINTDEGRLLSAAHQADRAITLLRKAIALDPNFAEAHRALAVAYIQKNQDSDAIAEGRRGVELDPNDYEQASLGYVYAMAGKRTEAQSILSNLSKPRGGQAPSPVYLSFIYIGLGENEKAFAALEQAYQEESALLSLVPTEVIFDPLRSDPRLQDLWQRARNKFQAE